MKLLKEAHIDIVTLNVLNEHFEMERTQFQGISLDYRRFNSESILAYYQMEYDVIKRVTPNIPITTNLMGFYKGLDYKMWQNQWILFHGITIQVEQMISHKQL